MKVQDLFNTKYDASGWTNEQKTKFLDKADALGFRVPRPIYSRFNADNAYYLNYEENDRSPFGNLFATSASSLTEKCARKELLYKDVMNVEIEHPQKPEVELEDQGDIDAELDAIFGPAPDPKEELQKELDASAKKWIPDDEFNYEPVTESIFCLEGDFRSKSLWFNNGTFERPTYNLIEGIHDLAFHLVNGNVYRQVEKKWYECISEGGVLCWSWNTKENGAVSLIVGYDSSSDNFKSLEGFLWPNARPLTKEEIKQFMDNAPE